MFTGCIHMISISVVIKKTVGSSNEPVTWEGNYISHDVLYKTWVKAKLEFFCLMLKITWNRKDIAGTIK